MARVLASAQAPDCNTWPVQILPAFYPDPQFANNGHHYGGGMWRPPYPPPAGVFPPVCTSFPSSRPSAFAGALCLIHDIFVLEHAVLSAGRLITSHHPIEEL